MSRVKFIIVFFGILATLSFIVGCSTGTVDTSTPVSPVGAVADNTGGQGDSVYEHNQGDAWNSEGVTYTITWKTIPADPSMLKDYGVEGRPSTEVTIGVKNDSATVITNPDGHLGLTVTVNGETLRNQVFARATGTDVLPGKSGSFTAVFEEAHGDVQVKLISQSGMTAAYWVGTV